MTNREYMENLSDKELAEFIYSDMLVLGQSYTNSIQGLTEWLSKDYAWTKIKTAVTVYALQEAGRLANDRERVSTGSVKND